MAKQFSREGFDITKNEEVYQGQNSNIDAVTVSTGNHSVNLLKKKFTGPYSIEFQDGHKWHTYLQKKGYPVLPTFRYDTENETEYITDLRRGGTHRVIDFCNHHSASEKIFLSNVVELEIEMQKLLAKSADDGLIINEPNIFFDIEISSGIARVIMGDLRELGYHPFDEGPTWSRDEVFEHNQTVLKGHLDRLKAIATDFPQE